MNRYELSERRACRLIGLARSTKRYQARVSEKEARIRAQLQELAVKRPRYGYRRLHALLKRAGEHVNHKRVYRLYRELGLPLRRRRRRKLMRRGPGPAAVPSRANERWSMDFVSDSLSNGQALRVLTVVDDHTRECVAVEVDTSLPGERVCRVLESAVGQRGRPMSIVVDNGPEFRGRTLQAWSEQRQVSLRFIEPGKPVQNAYIESFNGRLRDECLNANWFVNVKDARRKIRAWREEYNRQRPHSSLSYKTPAEYAEQLGVRALQ